MIVADASAVVLGLLNDGDARGYLAAEAVVVPHLADSEVAHALRAGVLQRELPAEAAGRALATWMQLGVRRSGITGLLPRVWELRDSLSAYDASYVVLAEALDCELLTADTGLASAPGPACPITVVRR